MVVTSFVRGHKISYDENIGWVFENGDKVGDVLEVCPRCCQYHLPDDCDYCLKYLQKTDFIVSACCGHGVEQGYIQLADGRLFKEVKQPITINLTEEDKKELRKLLGLVNDE